MHAGLNARSKHASLSLTASLAALRAGYKPERQVIKDLLTTKQPASPAAFCHTFLLHKKKIKKAKNKKKLKKNLKIQHTNIRTKKGAKKRAKKEPKRSRTNGGFEIHYEKKQEEQIVEILRTKNDNEKFKKMKEWIDKHPEEAAKMDVHMTNIKERRIKI